MVALTKQRDVPFFSVIITTYNRAGLLPRALDSLINQTESDWEAVIVDDGSTDDTYIQIAPYLKGNQRMRYTKQMNQGPAGAKNTGISLAKGAYITFLDSDDEYSPAHLAIRKSILLEDEHLGFLYGGVKIIGNQFVPDKNHRGKRINLSDCVIGGTFFIERKVVAELEGFENLPLGNDADFFEKVKKAGISTLKIDQPTYIYHRESHKSVTHSFLQEGSSSFYTPN